MVAISSYFKGLRSKEKLKSGLTLARNSPEQDGVNINDWYMENVAASGGSGRAQRTPNEDNAYTIPVVYAINKILSEDLASTSYNLHDRVKAGNSELNFKHPSAQLLDRPNSIQNGFTFRETMYSGLFMRGNAFSRIHYDSKGNAGELEYLMHEDVDVDYDRFHKRKELYYFIRGRRLPVMPYEMIHYKGISKDGIMGVSPIQMLNYTLHEMMRAQDVELDFADNGARVRSILSTPNKLSEESYKRIKRSFSSTHMGPQADPTLILEEGLAFTPVSLSPQDAGLLMSRKWSLEELSRPWRVPMHLLNVLDKATYSNVEHQSLEYVKFCMKPNARRVEAEDNRKLLTTREQSKRFFKHDLQDLIQSDAKAEAEYLKIMYQNGFFTQNEVRAKKNYPPVEGGDVLMTPVSMRDRLTEPLGGKIITDKKGSNEEE